MSFLVYEPSLRPFVLRESQRLNSLLENLGVTTKDKIEILVSEERDMTRDQNTRDDYVLGDFLGNQVWHSGYRVVEIQNGKVWLLHDDYPKPIPIYCYCVVDVRKTPD